MGFRFQNLGFKFIVGEEPFDFGESKTIKGVAIAKEYKPTNQTQ